jgi:tetratricopeptide (TPR) repeat protein
MALSEVARLSEADSKAEPWAAARLGAAGKRADARGNMQMAEMLFSRAVLLAEGKEQAELQHQRGLAAIQGAGRGAAACAPAQFAEVVEMSDASAETRALAAVEYAYWLLANGLNESTADLRTAAVEAIATLTETGHHSGLATVHGYRGFVDSIGGHWKDATPWLDKALYHARRADDAQVETKALVDRTGPGQYGRTHVDEADSQLRTMLDESDGRYPSRPPLSEKQRAWVEGAGFAPLEAMRGNAGAARRQSERLKDACDEGFGPSFDRAVAGQVAGWAALLAGDYVLAEDDLSYSLEILERMGEKGFLPTTAGLLAESLYRQGHLAQALALTDTVRESAIEEDVASQVMWRITRGKVMARNGEVVAGRELVLEAVQLAARTDDLNLHGDAEAALAVVSYIGGRHQDATDARAKARELFHEKGNEVSERGAASLGGGKA